MRKQIEPELILKNLTSQRISVFGSVSIEPWDSVDVFKKDHKLTEADVIDSLSPPNGNLYLKIHKQKVVKIDKISLFGLSNSEVTLENIVASGEPGYNKFLSIDSDDKLCWKFIESENTIDVASPLYRKEGELKIHKASVDSNGFLSKEDWLLFKGKSNGFRVWQYQDFHTSSSVVTLTQFENGKDFLFNKGYIVDGSAIVVSRKNLEKKPTRKGFFSRMLSSDKSNIEVAQHVGDQVILSGVPHMKIRVYFLLSLPVGIRIPDDYKAPPRIVRKERVRYIDALDLGYGGNKDVFGNKAFKESISVGGELDVFGNTKLLGEFSSKSLRFTRDPAAHKVLTSNSLGDSQWKASPTVDSNPPNNAYDGQLWVRKPDLDIFVYNHSLDNWLSISSQITISGGTNSTSLSDSYLRGYDNVSMGINSDVLPFDATLVMLYCSSEVSSNWRAEVHSEGKLKKDATLNVVNSDRAYSCRMNVDFSEGQKIQLFVSGERVSMPKITAIFRKRLK